MSHFGGPSCYRRTLSLEEWRVTNLQVTVIKLPPTLINAVFNLAKELGHFPIWPKPHV